MRKIREQLKAYYRAKTAINEQYPIAHVISSIFETVLILLLFKAISYFLPL